MDPVETREERLTTGSAVAPERVVEPAGGRQPVEAMGRGATPAAEAAPAAAPVATTSTSRSGVYPVTNRAAQAIWLIVGVLDVMLALDFIFRAAGGANTGFAHYVYKVGGWLASPFDGIFTNTQIVNGNTFIRWADVLAVAIYSLIALAFVKLVQIVSKPR